MQKMPMSRVGITYYVFGRSVRANKRCNEPLLGEVLFYIPTGEFVLIETEEELEEYRKLPSDDYIVMMKVGRSKPRMEIQNYNFKPSEEAQPDGSKGESI